jgi:hypothetical protein
VGFTFQVRANGPGGSSGYSASVAATQNGCITG